MKHALLPIACCGMLGLLAACGTGPAVIIPTGTVALSVDHETLFEVSTAKIRNQIDARIADGVDVPLPADAGGGYTHEQHKQNGKTIYEAGMLYSLTGEARYRDFAASILLDYAALYPDLGLHPKQKEQTPGRLFWQSLNESVWLVYAIQGYEAIKPDLEPGVQAIIEDSVFRPMAEFLSEGQPETFDKIHNHGTWAVAAVGMTGFVLGEDRWVKQALLGLDQSGNAGFLRQLDELFSPDGYYAEGPYYQRFALMPFVLFADAVEKNDPDRNIFDYRDGILLKAVYATIQQSYAGRFFPINDSIREKGLNTIELKYAIAMAYKLTGDTSLLDVVGLQDGVVPTPEGKKLARDLSAGMATPFKFKSILLRDGPAGNQGALAVLRSGEAKDAAAVVFKPTSQGLGHGHFDRLGLLYYDDGHEIVADYGAARFLNVEPKFGGHYLPENETWAKQSIAHNVLVVDQKSQFGGDWTVAQEFAPRLLAFDAGDEIQFTAAELDTAYDGVSLQRLVAMVPRPGSGRYIIDVMRARSDNLHRYDLPVHFKGQLIETNFELVHSPTQLLPFGADNGYQHLWQRAVSQPIDAVTDMSWLVEDQFYTLTFAASAPVTAFLTQLGANDPYDNLRREQALVLRVDAPDADFVSVYERHGRYDNDEEVTVFSGRSVASIAQSAEGDVVIYTITATNGRQTTIIWADDPSQETEHSMLLHGETINWTGPVTIRQSE
ncbi:MAG: alginate lyase family protein [Acidobacteria bacterium]|nr:alginate lyase family protein [Acidobacteriota bacterium]